MIGRQVGNYRILAKINSGSFGTVYQGKHIIFENRPLVAIKLLHTALPSEEKDAEFRQEAEILEKLNHPHILRILDAGFQDSAPYLVTEYAAGGSLRDRLKTSNGKPFPLDEAITILDQIGQALKYAHEQRFIDRDGKERRIIHRDLKPENILFNEVGNALLADFGIAVLLESSHTGRVGMGGTPLYMAPEQFEGLVSARSDQYSLSCIAYELVTGHRIFTIPPNAGLEAFWYQHTQVQRIPPRHYNPQLPIHIEKAVLTALAKDRKQRYKDVPTFIQALFKSSSDWVNEGDGHYKAKRYKEALTAYDQAIYIDPNDARAYAQKSTTLHRLKRYDEALTACDQAILLDSNDARAYNIKSNVLRALGRLNEARQAFEKAREIERQLSQKG